VDRSRAINELWYDELDSKWDDHGSLLNYGMTSWIASGISLSTFSRRFVNDRMHCSPQQRCMPSTMFLTRHRSGLTPYHVMRAITTSPSTSLCRPYTRCVRLAV
jgi:hypothetical protein